jgi:ferredoxin-fold anticodon binding domain-containing protein
MCYCKSPKIGKTQVLSVNPSIYHSGAVKVRKMLVNASISDFYQTIAVNDNIYQRLLVKAVLFDCDCACLFFFKFLIIL